MIHFDKLTQKAQEAVQHSQVLAAEVGHQLLHPLHLLVGLAEQHEGVVHKVLSKLGAPLGLVAQEERQQFQTIPVVSGSTAGTYMAPSLNELFGQAQKEAANFTDEYVSTEHLLLAVAGMKHDTAGQILKKAGATREMILQALQSVRGTQRITDQNQEAKYQVLEHYDEQSGARPMKRAIQRLIQDPLALKILNGEIGEGDTVLVDYNSAEMHFEKKEAVAA